MIRFVFRFAGLWILAAGFVALVRDGTKSIAGNAVFITKLGEDWANFHGSSLESLKVLVERYAGAGGLGTCHALHSRRADLAGARHHRLDPDPDRPQEEAIDRLRPRLAPKEEGRGRARGLLVLEIKNYLIVSAPALQATPSCGPVAPEQPIAPMILPPSTSG